MNQHSLFPKLQLPEGIVATLRLQNPWWEDRPMRQLPTTRRHLVGQIHARLQARIAPILVVRGPRQVGKTTAQLQVIADLLQRGVPPRNILRFQADELPDLLHAPAPITRLVEWYEHAVLGGTLNELARRKEPTYLLLDEVQNLPDWAPQLKSLVDHATTQVVVTGSSALRIEQGRDSLAGRIHTIEAGVLSLTEIGMFRGFDLGRPFLPDNGLEPLLSFEFWMRLREHGLAMARDRDVCFAAFSERGGYPFPHERQDLAWPAVADQLNETVIRRVIQHDLRTGQRGRKRDGTLLEELFRLACRYVGQAPEVRLLAREAQRALGANVGPQRVREYLKFLGDTLLLRLVEPLEIRLKKRHAGTKLCLADHGLRASWLQEQIPIAPAGLDRAPELSSLAGHIAESVVGVTLATVSHLDLAWSPPRPNEPEIDFVLTIGTQRIPLEVKYQRRIDELRDTEGLRTFMEKAANKAPFGILVTQVDGAVVRDPRIVCLPLSSLMLLR
jgi:predicted AAA+ superfamily ATPase